MHIQVLISYTHILIQACRCVKHNWTSSCVDILRKQREVKKRAIQNVEQVRHTTATDDQSTCDNLTNSFGLFDTITGICMPHI